MPSTEIWLPLQEGQPLHEATVGASRSALLLILGAVGLLLAIVCANVAGLWLTRIAARTREVAIRSALGAGRSRILRQLLAESLVLAVAGGVGGVLLARGLTGFLMSLAPDTQPRHSAVAIDGGVLSYAAVVSTLCGLLVGIAPALRAAASDPGTALRVGRRSSGMSGRGLQRALVIVQVAAFASRAVSPARPTRSRTSSSPTTGSRSWDWWGTCGGGIWARAPWPSSTGRTRRRAGRRRSSC